MQPSPWGENHVELAFAGIQFRIEGLAESQCGPILARYGLNESETGSRRAQSTISAAQKSFDIQPMARYTDPVYGYRHLVEEGPDHTLEIEGLDYRGSITVLPSARGTLYTNTAAEAAHPTVFENYLRILSAILALQQGGLLLHSAGIVVDGRAFLCLGRSGAGKSTLSGKALAAGATILSDDGNMMLPSPNGGFEAGPVPFAGDLGQTACRGSRPYPVAGLFWLNQGDELKLEPLSPALAFSRVMACAPTVNSIASLSESLDAVLLDILGKLPMFQLCSRRKDSFEDIYACMATGLPG